MSSTLAIGLVADHQQALNALQAVLLPSPYKVVSACVGADFAESQRQAEVDIWVLELGDEAFEHVVDELYANSEATILLGDGVPDAQTGGDYKRWQQRLLEKIGALLDSGDALASQSNSENSIVSQAKEQNSGAEYLWVLAASLGGPETLPSFLQALADDLPIGFIYAQHTNSEQDKVLTQVLDKGHQWRLKTCQPQQFVQAGEILVVPVDHQIEIQKNGLVRNLEQPWPKPYSPNISQVVAQVGKAYGDKSGVIVFTGMCDDGASGAAELKQQGGEVWIQSPSSCICDAMPSAVEDLAIANRSGEPKQLAQALNQRYRLSLSPVGASLAK